MQLSYTCRLKLTGVFESVSQASTCSYVPNYAMNSNSNAKEMHHIPYYTVIAECLVLSTVNSV